MEVANIEDMCYMSTYSSSQICTSLNAVFGLGLDKNITSQKSLIKNKKKFKVGCPYNIYEQVKNGATPINSRGYAILRSNKC